jgi:hypothetical protein
MIPKIEYPANHRCRIADVEAKLPGSALGGAEYALTGNLHPRAECRYADFRTTVRL